MRIELVRFQDMIVVAVVEGIHFFSTISVFGHFSLPPKLSISCKPDAAWESQRDWAAEIK